MWFPEISALKEKCLDLEMVSLVKSNVNYNVGWYRFHLKRRTSFKTWFTEDSELSMSLFQLSVGHTHRVPWMCTN